MFRSCSLPPVHCVVSFDQVSDSVRRPGPRLILRYVCCTSRISKVHARVNERMVEPDAAGRLLLDCDTSIPGHSDCRETATKPGKFPPSRECRRSATRSTGMTIPRNWGIKAPKASDTLRYRTSISGRRSVGDEVATSRHLVRLSITTISARWMGYIAVRIAGRAPVTGFWRPAPWNGSAGKAWRGAQALPCNRPSHPDDPFLGYPRGAGSEHWNMMYTRSAHTL